MAIFNYAARELTAKIVYYGPGLSGKTTSIQYIHGKINPKSKGKLVSLATETDRTLFFDFFPLEFGQIGGFKVKFNFYTVPGQVFYNTTRKLVLKGADGVVFVADSQPGMMDQNVESLENLKENLKAHGIDAETVPFVLQYNKRDLPGALSVEELRRTLNARGLPEFETVATSGGGIMEAMKAICRMVLEDLQEKQRGAMGRGTPRAAAPGAGAEPTSPARAEAPPPRAPAAPRETPPAPGVPESRPAARPAGVERSLSIPASGPGASQVVLRLPLELELEAGVDSVRVTAEVRVSYAGGRGQALVRELSLEPAAEERPRRKGLLARLFGGG
ncbi:MAG: GTPase domain-containing protein [Deltaproteobacteria bacterium]|nr:GTPase domain-containing protein [Deltaproteobacteria bacterium]